MELVYRAAEQLYIPALIVILGLLVYSLVETGRLVAVWALRLRIGAALSAYRSGGPLPSTAGGLVLLPRLHRDNVLADAEILALKQLEGARLAARIAPMAGLIATLVPMGPALVALIDNDLAQMSTLLRDAFAAVVLALAAASLAFWVATVRKRWCAEELAAFEARQRATP